MSVTIYHNPRCSKSRQTLALLEEHGVQPEIIEYLKTPPSEGELDRILNMLGKEPHELMRSGEEEFKAHVKDKNLSRNEAIALMVAYPKIIERPIVINGDRAAVGRPPESVLNILN
ncbi:MAG: arsenate reductase (glutaredoxin) [Mariprofundus sp.]|nr:arsenate reductase (glutaredoxin) [Mariprofundus sp.]